VPSDARFELFQPATIGDTVSRGFGIELLGVGPLSADVLPGLRGRLQERAAANFLAVAI
jgi:hypothetical protein